MMDTLDSFICEFEIVFMDFDGVIKDSVGIKSQAFGKLFAPYGDELRNKVKLHHEMNSGVSRFEKIPLYLSWANESLSRGKVEKYYGAFSRMVKQQVVESPWVPGVRDFIEHNHLIRKLVIVTATPQTEIVEILRELDLTGYFENVFGSPTTKNSAIASILHGSDIDPGRAVMIGDSLSDYDAAMFNCVEFVLRRTPLNHDLQNREGISMINDFSDTQIEVNRKT